eukprot:TRINITY_DN35723_c0_g1_i1.p1 TRINITY_DN35723_c0_g1~~TRINITY_DN35723_c0_g1_i1.p1  ORF type:complete len:403 (+),score=97.38 TRINITY_DN35723_c0_g1_i1:133-1341(+)
MASGDAGTSSRQNGGEQPRSWGLHEDTEGQGKYFYCAAVEISTWVRHLDLPPNVSPEQATDEQLWCALFDRQIREAYKLCNVCASPQEKSSNPFFVCGSCSRHCHLRCSGSCSSVVCTEVWENYAPYLRSCDSCEGKKTPSTEFVPGGMTPDQLSAQACLNRLKSVQLPHALRAKLTGVEEKLATRALPEKEANDQIAELMTEHHCPNGSHRLFQLSKSSKGGVGVFATTFVPRLTRVGIYPGYPDPLSGEQGSRGRPTPKYALAEFNAADYYNCCFPELRGCLTQFINEPGVGEQSNVAWLQERSPIIEDGRLSIVTVKDLQEGDECTLSYGPLYPRDYPYSYDAYSFHPVSEDPDDPTGVYALWYYGSRDAEAENKGYVRYDHRTDRFRPCSADGQPTPE